MSIWTNFTVKIHTPTLTNLTVGISSEKTEINSAGIQIVRNSDRYVIMERAGSSDTMIKVGGEIRATGNIVAYSSSDEKLKENITPIKNALAKIEKIEGVEFDWIKEYIKQKGEEDGYFVRKHDVGVIAQKIEEVLPEVVATTDDGYKAVRYEKIVALLIQAIKELKKEVDELKNR